MNPNDITTWTPAEVDTALAEVWERMAPIQDRRWTAIDDKHSAKSSLKSIEDGRYRGYRSAERLEQDIVTADAVIEKADAELAVLREECRPYNEEYGRRGYWTRAWLVDNKGGHVHKTMDCSTCFERTRFGWLPQVSGLNEEEIVGLAGESACTVCYPSAPAEVLNNPSALELPKRREERLAREAEKEAKRVAKAAKSLSIDGSVVTVSWSYEGVHVNYRTSERTTKTMRGSKELKTYRAAELFLIEALANEATGRDKATYDQPTKDVMFEVMEMMAAKKNTTTLLIHAGLMPRVNKKVQQYA
jgi:hypothetical protein